MCSCRTYVPMIACLSIPGFELRAALRRTPSLALRPAALAPAPGGQRAARSGPSRPPPRRLGSGRGCGSARRSRRARGSSLVEQDPAAAEQAWEEIAAPARGRGLRGRPGRARLRVLRDARSRAPLRRARAGAASARSPRSGRRGTRGSARPSGGSRRSRRRPSRGRASCSSSPTSSMRAVPRAAAAARSCRSSAPLRRAATRSACSNSESLPGSRAAPSPNGWGRTAGAPGAWREAGRPRACAGAARPPSSSRRSSSRRRSGTS